MGRMPELMKKWKLRLKMKMRKRTKECHESCNRAFTSTLVSHTNLLLVVVDTSCTCHPSPSCTCQFNMKPTKVEYNAHTEGEKLKTNLYRRQPAPSSYYS